jgi:protein-disulfide isomerase
MSGFSLAKSALMGIGALCLVACSGGADGANTNTRSSFEREGDRSTGSAEAPVTIIEYASVACGGCAIWHETSMPTVKQYIESGDVRFVMREMLTGQRDLAVAGFMLASCVDENRYFDVVDVLFDQQRALFAGMRSGTALPQFEAIARSAGLSEDTFRTCMSDVEILNEVEGRAEESFRDGISATPTFIVNGQQLERVPSPSPDVSGTVWGANGEAFVDENGPIPADPRQYSAESFERIILYFKDQAASSAETDG